MLNKLRGFSNTKLAGVLIAIIIVPFVFWGMGSVFSGGNTNNIAKINKETISTKDFVEHINQSRISNEIIKENLGNNILEEMLSQLVSEKLLDMEIKSNELSISEKTLANKIKNNLAFQDDDRKFSRIKYEKFLLENNLNALDFEAKLKKDELRKNLFYYFGGGIRSPYFFKNKIYINEEKNVELEYLNLDLVYDKSASTDEINKFIIENNEKLKIDNINFSYTKIFPKDLIQINDFNDEFFKKIDEIENDILNGENLKQIGEKFNLKIIEKNNFQNTDEENDLFKSIYSKRNEEKIQLEDKNNYFLLYEISKINKILPDREDEKFIDLVKKNVIFKKKYEYNQNLYKQIQDKKLNDIEFIKIAKKDKNIKKTIIKNIKDINNFTLDSVKLIYSLPKESFSLISDGDGTIYLAKIKNITFNSLDENDDKIKDFGLKSNNNLINDIYTSYDSSLNKKYKVKIFNSTMDRVKNYFQ